MKGGPWGRGREGKKPLGREGVHLMGSSGEVRGGLPIFSTLYMSDWKEAQSIYTKASYFESVSSLCPKIYNSVWICFVVYSGGMFYVVLSFQSAAKGRPS